MRVSKASQKSIDKLRAFLQLTEQISKIDIDYKADWKDLKNDWEDDEDFSTIIKEIEDENGFNPQLYFDYFKSDISHLYGRILFGFETLIDNCCNPDVDYLDFNDDIKKGLELLEQQSTNTEYDTKGNYKK